VRRTGLKGCSGTPGATPGKPAFLGVNLEGIVSDGWPVARFLERELNRPRLFDLRDRIHARALVQAVWHRTWQISLRRVIREKHIGVSVRMLPDIKPGRVGCHTA
jgi:hypothetical protein